MINLVLAGQLLGTAFASGLNLYATVAVLGLAVRLGWIADLPAGLGGLGNGIVIGSAVALLLVEFAARRTPLVGSAWEAAHTIIRPAAAGMLAVLATDGAPSPVRAAAALAAVAVALAAHGGKAGLRLMRSAPAYPRRTARAGTLTLLTLLEDVLAVAVAGTAILYPRAAAYVVGAALLAILLAGPRLWRAALLGLRSVTCRARAFFGPSGWRSREQLPRRLRSVVPVEPLGRSPARAVPAAIVGVRQIGAYRHGWLVFTCDGPCFVYRSMFGVRRTELPPAADVRLHPGALTDVLAGTGNGNGNGKGNGACAYTIYLLKDGPPALHTAEAMTAVMQARAGAG